MCPLLEPKKKHNVINAKLGEKNGRQVHFCLLRLLDIMWQNQAFHLHMHCQPCATYSYLGYGLLFICEEAWEKGPIDIVNLIGLEYKLPIGLLNCLLSSSFILNHYEDYCHRYVTELPRLYLNWPVVLSSLTLDIHTFANSNLTF